MEKERSNKMMKEDTKNKNVGINMVKVRIM